MRLPGWEIKLNDLIEKVSKQPFEYGKFDCCLLAAEVIRTLKGIDIRKEIIPDPYQNKDEADELLRKYGGIEGIAGLVAERYGFKTIPVLFAQRGDVLIANVEGIDSPGRRSLAGNFGVCIGKKVAFLSPSGLVFLSITSKLIKKAWRI